MSGCATSGPLHLYSLAAADERPIVDHAPGGKLEVPSFLEATDEITGFAYDPFTDHFFLRLAPGNLIRVVDRPARAIKREFTIDDAPPKSSGDLAVRPRDGHLFLLVPDGVMETTRLGKFVRTFPLESGGTQPIGIAFDMLRDRLLVLRADGQTLAQHDDQGKQLSVVRLAQPVERGLGFHAEERHVYAPLRERAGEIGVFDETGNLVRALRAEGPFIDVGIRSFVRVF